jgi:hypothetical protein
MAALQITGALRSTPSDVLDAHTNILPIRLQVVKLCHAAALRIVTLPKTHPLHKPACHTFRFFVKQHQAPFHSIMQTLVDQPKSMEIIQPVHASPNWSSLFSVHIEGSRQEAIEYLRNFQADIKVYSDGSGYEGGIGASAVLY